MEKSTKEQRLETYRKIREMLRELGDINHAEGNGYMFMAIERKDAEQFSMNTRCGGTKGSLGAVITRLMDTNTDLQDAIITAALVRVTQLGCVEMVVEKPKPIAWVDTGCTCSECNIMRNHLKEKPIVN